MNLHKPANFTRPNRIHPLTVAIRYQLYLDRLEWLANR